MLERWLLTLRRKQILLDKGFGQVVMCDGGIQGGSEGGAFLSWGPAFCSSV